MEKYWRGSWPVKCDICKVELANRVHFIDGRTKTGSWGLLCTACHKMHGVGLGTGRGQKYDSKTLKKVEG